MSLARFVALCTGVGVLVALWQTHPLALAPTATVIDDGTLDAFQFTWNLWWVREALLELHTNPFHTRYLFYPDGIGLLFHTFSSTFGLLSIPLQVLLPGGALTANNVLVMASPVMTVLAVGLLARDVTQDGWAALAGGVAAAMSPVAAWFLPVIYLHCGYLIALCLWAWGRLHRRAHAGWALLACLLVWALVLASAEYAMMALALLALDTAARSILARPLGLTRPWWPGTLGFWALTGAGVLSLAAFAGGDPAEPPPMRQLLAGRPKRASARSMPTGFTRCRTRRPCRRPAGPWRRASVQYRTSPSSGAWWSNSPAASSPRSSRNNRSHPTLR
jgi:hypothetical protein